MAKKKYEVGEVGLGSHYIIASNKKEALKKYKKKYNVVIAKQVYIR